jgi:hypothetical protein
MSKSKNKTKTAGAAAVSDNPLVRTSTSNFSRKNEDNPYVNSNDIPKILTNQITELLNKQKNNPDVNLTDITKNLTNQITEILNKQKNNPDINLNDITKNLTNQIVEILNKEKNKPDVTLTDITKNILNKILELLSTPIITSTATDIPKILTNQIIQILNNPEVIYDTKPELLTKDPTHNLSMYIINKCYYWIELTLQPIASTSGYFVKNAIITTTVPFSLLFNDVTTVLMAWIQSFSLANKIRNMNIINIVLEKPAPNFLSPYIENSEAEIQNIKDNLDYINLFRIKIKNSILVFVNLIIANLREINDKNKQKNVTEFIDALENTKEDKSNEVAKNLFTTFSEVIFGYKSIQKKEPKEVNNKGGKLRLFLHSRRSTTRRRRTIRRRRSTTTRRRSTIRRRRRQRRQ